MDLGELRAARALLKDAAWTVYRANAINVTTALYDVLLARYHLAEGNDPSSHLESLRAWSSRTGDMDCIIEAHLLSARRLLGSGDSQAALAEAEAGLLHAVSCGYRLLRIELLVALARIRLVWPDPPKAIQAAREAIDLATHADCQYAWARRTPRRSGAKRTSPITSPNSPSGRSLRRSRSANASSTQASLKPSDGSRWLEPDHSAPNASNCADGGESAASTQAAIRSFSGSTP